MARRLGTCRRVRAAVGRARVHNPLPDGLGPPRRLWQHGDDASTSPSLLPPSVSGQPKLSRYDALNVRVRALDVRALGSPYPPLRGQSALLRGQGARPWSSAAPPQPAEAPNPVAFGLPAGSIRDHRCGGAACGQTHRFRTDAERCAGHHSHRAGPCQHRHDRLRCGPHHRRRRILRLDHHDGQGGRGVHRARQQGLPGRPRWHALPGGGDLRHPGPRDDHRLPRRLQRRGRGERCADHLQGRDRLRRQSPGPAGADSEGAGIAHGVGRVPDRRRLRGRRRLRLPRRRAVRLGVRGLLPSDLRGRHAVPDVPPEPRDLRCDRGRPPAVGLLLGLRVRQCRDHGGQPGDRRPVRLHPLPAQRRRIHRRGRLHQLGELELLRVFPQLLRGSGAVRRRCRWCHRQPRCR